MAYCRLCNIRTAVHGLELCIYCTKQEEDRLDTERIGNEYTIELYEKQIADLKAQVEKALEYEQEHELLIEENHALKFMNEELKAQVAELVKELHNMVDHARDIDGHASFPWKPILQAEEVLIKHTREEV